MNKKQINEQLEKISKELSTSVVHKVEKHDKVSAIEDIEGIMRNLNILIYEIKRI